MGESREVTINLRPLREQIEAMSVLMRKAAEYDHKLADVLDNCAKEIKDTCGGMGARVTFK
jgi:hypothetical protein